MTPLEIHLLLNLYHSEKPAERYPEQERTAPAMKAAFAWFRVCGLTLPGVTVEAVMERNAESEQFLSAKGMLLVERLMEVQP